MRGGCGSKGLFGMVGGERREREERPGAGGK
jgi:hypothetical protein